MLADVIHRRTLRHPRTDTASIRRPSSVRPPTRMWASLCPSVPLSLRNNHSLPASRCGRRAGTGGGDGERAAQLRRRRRRRPCNVAMRARHEGGREGGREGGSVRPVRRRVRALFNGANHRLSSFRNSAHYWHRLSGHSNLLRPSIYPSLPPPYHVAHDSPVAQAGTARTMHNSPDREQNGIPWKMQQARPREGGVAVLLYLWCFGQRLRED